MILKIYVEDFKNLNDWFAICKQLRVDKTSTVISIDVENAVGKQEE